jgi:hypothetical protein
MYHFVVSYEIRKYKSSNFVLFQDCLAILGPLHFHEFQVYCHLFL